MKILWMTLFLFFTGIVSAFSQLKFHVADFAVDPFDLTARNDQYKKIDGSGALYAIIKVSGDDLKEYNFNFGNMNHLVESHEDQLWVYVQKNAKQVTISRNGYTSLRNYDFRTTIESGKTYRMQLSAQGPVIYTQMVMFQTEPKVVGAMVTVQREGDGSTKELFGATGTTGGVAKSLEFGTYTYEVMAENYHSTEGRFTLNNQNETHLEKVMLRSNGANITLSVASDADIYVNGEKRGTRSWTGLLRAGNYQVECRQRNHKSSSQTITVTEGEDRTITLTPPTPITGVLAVTSEPLGASIKIDGKDCGVTPRNITDVLIGQHEVKLRLEGYITETKLIEVKENETAELNISLDDDNASPKRAMDLYDKKEYSQAVEIFKKLADHGDAEAQYNLGQCYEMGHGVAKDLHKAFFWWEKAANQGLAKAQLQLSECYDKGYGVERDMVKSMNWYTKFLENPNSQKELLDSTLKIVREGMRNWSPK